MRRLYFLLVFSVLAILLDFLHVPPLVIFVVAALGIIPLAALIGQARFGCSQWLRALVALFGKTRFCSHRFPSPSSLNQCRLGRRRGGRRQCPARI